MKKFTVSVPYVVNYEFTVEADDERQAMQIVEHDSWTKQELPYDEVWVGQSDSHEIRVQEVK